MKYILIAIVTLIGLAVGFYVIGLIISIFDPNIPTVGDKIIAGISFSLLTSTAGFILYHLGRLFTGKV